MGMWEFTVGFILPCIFRKLHKKKIMLKLLFRVKIIRF